MSISMTLEPVNLNPQFLNAFCSCQYLISSPSLTAKFLSCLFKLFPYSSLKNFSFLRFFPKEIYKISLKFTVFWLFSIEILSAEWIYLLGKLFLARVVSVNFRKDILFRWGSIGMKGGCYSCLVLYGFGKS